MTFSFLNKRIAGNILFILVFVGLFFLYDLNNSLFDLPQSVHMWRQTNCLSLTLNYHQYDLPLWEPEMHNQFGGGGYSGKAAGEFPIIYYMVAQLWDMFGAHEWIFKLVQVFILFFGLYALFHGLKFIVKNQLLAGFISLLVFTSPMVVFYGPNYLPDVPSLSFVFIAWYFVIRYLEKRNNLILWLSALFFCLAMLLKITAALSFIALGGWIIIEILFMKKDQCVFCLRWKQLIPFLLALVPVISWYLYVEHYNRINQGHISFHGIWPIWNMTSEQYARIIEVLDKIYFKEMFLPFAQYLTFAIWLFLLIRIKKLKPVFRYFIIVLPLGMAFQLVLWFQVLEGHDYYMINLVIVFVAVWAIFLAQLKNLNPPVKIAVSVLAAAFLLWNAIACSKRIENRYLGWMNDMYHRMKALNEIEPSFREWGIQPDDKVISLPDFTINASLYYMNRRGYTEFGSDFTQEEGFYQRIEQGAKYLIISDSTIVDNEHIKPFTQKRIGKFKNIFVFDVRNISPE